MKKNITVATVAAFCILLAIEPAFAATFAFDSQLSSIPVPVGKSVNISVLLNPEGASLSLWQAILQYDRTLISLNTRKGEGPYTNDQNVSYYYFPNQYGIMFIMGGTGMNYETITTAVSSQIAIIEVKGENIGQTTLSLVNPLVYTVGDVNLPGTMTKYNLSNISITIDVIDGNDPYENVAFSEYYIYLKDNSTGGIYFYENGKRRGFGSWESYIQRNPNNTGIIEMSSSQINAIPEGPTIHVFSTGNDVILEGSAGMPKYRMRDGYRRPISDWNDYLSKGWGGYNRSVLDIELASIPLGAPI